MDGTAHLYTLQEQATPPVSKRGSKCIQSLLFLTLSLMLLFLVVGYVWMASVCRWDWNCNPAPIPAYATTDDARFGELIFDENFDTLNLSRWRHELTLSGGGNWEFEYYVNNRTNSYVKEGKLYIKPTLTNNTFTQKGFMTEGTIDMWGGAPSDQCTSNAFYGCSRTGTSTNVLNSVQSARLRSVESFSFKYGRIEVRAQMPRGDWLWPAIWLLPKQEAYGNWPASGEIDLIESRGNDKLTKNGVDMGSGSVGTTLHWGPYFGADRWPQTTKTVTLPNGERFSAGYHNWTLDWTPQGFNCSVDGTMYLSVPTGSGYWAKGEFDEKNPGSANAWQYGEIDAPFDKEFYFVMNVASGGVSGYFPDGVTSQPEGLPSYGKPWSDTSGSTYGDFWANVAEWYPTWHPFENNGESAAMKVDYVRVYKYVG